MAEQENLCRKKLTEHGLKVTRQRIALIKLLSESNAPMTAEDLFLRLKDDFSTLSLSTIYRTLDTLCDKKMVCRSVLMDGGRALFEIMPETHSHNLICTVCHKITPLKDCPLNTYEASIAQATGYTISGHKLELYGICPSCLEHKKAQDSM